MQKQEKHSLIMHGGEMLQFCEILIRVIKIINENTERNISL
jgi:hypothetical protein